jgi:hypothetical protein
MGILVSRQGIAIEFTDRVDVSRFVSGAYIDGMEVTQGIQYYQSVRHLSQAGDRGEDNGVPLVAHKPAWVRVYVRSGLASPSVGPITGSLEVFRRSGLINWVPVATLAPRAPGVVTATQNPTYLSERSSLASTLNFVIPVRLFGLPTSPPVDVMCGHLRLKATIEAPGGRVDTLEVDVDAVLEQTLRIRAILISYNGPASANAPPAAPPLNLPAPGLGNVRTTAGFTLLTFPVQSQPIISSAGTIPQTAHLQDAVAMNNVGGCSPNWDALLTAVQEQRTNDGNRQDWLYYGLLPAGTPVGTMTGTNAGCGDDGIGVGPDGVAFGPAMAHELGHACGVQHAPCGNVGTGNRVEAFYPAYEPYDAEGAKQAFIGEYGLDMSRGLVLQPNTVRDFMSYCGPPWISLYTFYRLYNNPRLAPRFVCTDDPSWDEMEHDPWWKFPWHRGLDPKLKPWEDAPGVLEPLISIVGIVHEAQRIEVHSVMRVDAQRGGGPSTDLAAELLDSTGAVLARAPVVALRAQGGGCGCRGVNHTESCYPYPFQALLPNPQRGAMLVIRRGDTSIWSRQAAEAPPVVSAIRGKVANDRVTLTWSARRASGGTVTWVQWSNDRGKSWHAVTTGVRGSETTFSPSILPPGRVQLRVLVSDGFDTAVSRAAIVTVPRRPPEVSIFTPRDGQTFQAGQTMRAWGTAAWSTGELIPETSARWRLDGEIIAAGFDAFLEAPRPGAHRLILEVASDQGARRVSISFRTVNAHADRPGALRGPKTRTRPTRRAVRARPRRHRRT